MKIGDLKGWPPSVYIGRASSAPHPTTISSGIIKSAEIRREKKSCGELEQNRAMTSLFVKIYIDYKGNEFNAEILIDDEKIANSLVAAINANVGITGKELDEVEIQ
jgi:hypothetical protein